MLLNCAGETALVLRHAYNCLSNMITILDMTEGILNIGCLENSSRVNGLDISLSIKIDALFQDPIYRQ